MNAVVRETSGAVVATGEAASLMEVISRAASDPNIDVEKLERLMGMYERISTLKALEAFNDAMNQAQKEMRPIAADAVNPQTRSKYASYAKLDHALRPIYTKHGFSISYDEGESKKPDHVLVLAYVARGGYTRTYRSDMPADGKGAKGGDVMTKTHATGAAKSYGKRYLLKDIWNVAVGEEDRDGNQDDAPRITDSQVADLNALITEVGANKENFLKYLKLDALPNLRASSYKAAVAALEAKRRK